MRKRWFISSLLLFIALATVYAGLLGYRHFHNSGRARPVVRVGYLRLLSAAPLYAALREGYFDREGVDVQLRVIGSGPEGNEALAAGNIDVAFSILPSLLVARSKKVPYDLVSIYGASLDSPSIRDHRIILPIGSSLRRARDLIGKKIAIVGWPGMTSDVLEFLDYLDRHGISRDQVTLVGMPHGSMIAALQSRTIDAAAAAEPYVTLGIRTGKASLLAEDQGYYYGPEEEQVTTYVARQSWVAANQDTAKRFVAALEKARLQAADLNWLCTSAMPTFNTDRQPPIDFVRVTREDCLQMDMPAFREQVSDAGLQHVDAQLRKRGVISQNLADLGRTSINLLGDNPSEGLSK